MSILVTGGAGFIGSHITEECIKSGQFVYVLDDLSTGKRENLLHLPSSNYKLMVEDIRNRGVVDAFFKDHQIDHVFHEAAIASVQKSILEPENTYAVNVTGTENIFRGAAENNVKSLVFASSAAIYGDDPALPKDEGMQPKPISPYGEHKLENEKLALKYSGIGSTKFVGLRYFNVFGERQDPSSEYSGVISIFLNRLAANQRITVFGDGKQTRDFVYVKDVVQANLLAAFNTDVSFNIFNVGTAIQSSLLDLIIVIAKAYAVNAEINFQEARDGDIRYSYANIQKIKEFLRYFPNFSLSQGIQKIVEY